MDKNEIYHYGTPRHSGRYKWGSGKDSEQRGASFTGRVKELKKKGLSESEIAKGMGISINELRAKHTIAVAEQRKIDTAQALRYKDKGYSNIKIGELMGKNESSIRNLLNPAIQERSESTANTANMLKETLNRKPYLDVGIGQERYLGISRTKLKTSIALLSEEGYKIHYIKVPQLGTTHNTSIMILTKPGITPKDVWKNRDKISMITDHYSEDGGRSFLGLEPLRNIDSKRVHIKYAEDGGKDKDGVIELRRGVPELSLGDKNYAQVRIAVDGTHYMKGMAMYSDDIPKGSDIVYNTNKKSSVPKEKVFKEMEKDPDNPFGSTVRQKHYIDSKGEKQLSALNIMGQKEGYGEEGSWDKWSKSISSQVLSKQPTSLAESQLGKAYAAKKKEFDEILTITNPVIKQKLINSFADGCDSDAVHLKAAAMPRQASRVLLPIPSMKETEIYAPTFRDGEMVVLIRHPHGGRFEIPELKVNNRQRIAKSILGQAKDAVGINPKVAERLSGADFDGDSVLVIPNNSRLIRTASPLDGLKNFEPKERYGPYDGMKTIDGGIWNDKTGKVDYQGRSPVTRTKGLKMGDISNLITDMTIKGAGPEEIAAAVRHSMVVIDAEKHHLNYKTSYIDNGIAKLKKKYQGGERRGASTLISKASSESRVNYREEGKKILNPKTGKTKRVYVDPKTGEKLYEYTGESYTNNKGKIVKRMTPSTKMYEAKDAFELSSGTTIETVYATHANKLKALGNQSRKVALTIKPIPYSPSAKKAYAKEVASLNAKLNIALKNAPLERQAILLGNSIVAAKREANPNMDNADLKKLKGQALAEARVRMGAKKIAVEIEDREWEAIQAGAISTNTLSKIITNTDPDKLKQLATPKPNRSISPLKEQKIKTLLDSGYTQAEIADKLGLSTTTISKYLK